MPATLRLMSWNMQNYGSTGFNSYDLGRLIARTLLDYSIDICAMIEISNNGHALILNSIVVQLNNLGFHTNNWKHTFVNVGDEGVAYLWHEEAPGANAFKGYRYSNNAAKTIAGKVIKDSNGNLLYFPNTQTPWNSVPSQTNGRRAAYCAFETNDGFPPRRFTFLDIHTPFNTTTMIQAYTAKQYAKAREAIHVETTDAIHAIEQAKAAASAHIFADPKVSSRLSQATVDRLIDDMQVDMADMIAQGAPLADVLEGGANAGLIVTANMLTYSALSTAKRKGMALALALACAMAATYLVASIALPTAPPAATASIISATDAARDLADPAVTYNDPIQKTEPKIRSAVIFGARNGITAATSVFAFVNLPVTPMNATVLAGDFNINYPDITQYSRDASNKLGIGANAYTALETLAAPNLAAIAGKTTRIGPTAFESQRIYKLRMPLTIQHTIPGQPDYVDLDVSSLAGVDNLGRDAWIARLQGLARAQNKPWATIESVYGQLITDAFDSTTVINDTDYYKASKYDNAFIRGAARTASGVVDILSELGSWVGDASGHNRWVQALGHQNAIAAAHIASQNGGMPVNFVYDPGPISYDVTVNIDDAEQAAVFFDKFVSDHLPIFVEISI